MRNFFSASLLMAMLMTTLPSGTSQASDHDDGETDLKSRSLNLTDVYVFREDKEIGGGSAAHLVFLINSNPRSLPQQQYYFSTSARYELHIGRVGTSKDVPAVTDSDVTIRFEFGAPSASGIQAMSMTTIIDGVSSTYTSKDGGGAINTTPLSGAGAPVVSDVTVGGRVFKVFAGLRRDPFFFDVTAFFRFRLAAAGTGGNTPVPGFAAFPTYTPDGVTARDFTGQYNANTIAVRVPIAALQTGASETVFDNWATISIPE